MKRVVFQCDSCGKVADPVPDPNASDYAKRIPQSMGWYAIFPRLVESATAMGVRIEDGAHACGEKCALEILGRALRATHSPECGETEFTVRFPHRVHG